MINPFPDSASFSHSSSAAPRGRPPTSFRRFDDWEAGDADAATAQEAEHHTPSPANKTRAKPAALSHGKADDELVITRELGSQSERGNGRANAAVVVGGKKEAETALKLNDENGASDEPVSIYTVSVGEESLDDGQTNDSVRLTDADDLSLRSDGVIVVDSRPALGDAEVWDAIVMSGEDGDTDGSARDATSSDARDIEGEIVAGLPPAVRDRDVSMMIGSAGEEEEAGARGKFGFMKTLPPLPSVASDEEDLAEDEQVNGSVCEGEEEGGDALPDGSGKDEPAGSDDHVAGKEIDDEVPDVSITTPAVAEEEEDIDDDGVEAADARGKAEFVTTTPALVGVASDEKESFDDGGTKDSVPGTVEGRSDDELAADSRSALGDGDVRGPIAPMPVMVREEDDEAVGAPGKPELTPLDDGDIGDDVVYGVSDGSEQDGTCGGLGNDGGANDVDDEAVSELRPSLGVGEEEDIEGAASPPVMPLIVSDGRDHGPAGEAPLVGPLPSVATDGEKPGGEKEDDEDAVRRRRTTGSDTLSGVPGLLPDDGKFGLSNYPSGFLTQSFLSQRMVIDVTSVAAVASQFLPDPELAAGPEVENFLLGAFQSAEQMLGKCLNAVLGIDH
jgi:hypothetical protein